MKLLITGAGGMLGHSLMRLAAERHEVVGIYRSFPVSMRGGKSLTLDLADEERGDDPTFLRPALNAHLYRGFVSLDPGNARPRICWPISRRRGRESQPLRVCPCHCRPFFTATGKNPIFLVVMISEEFNPADPDTFPYEFANL